MNTIIYMVRHAESPFSFGEERSRGLSDAGEEAARQVASLLREAEIHYIASSPYKRAVRTVQYLAEDKGLSINEYEELIERPIKGLNYKSDWETLEKAIKQSFIDLDYALEGGESTRKAQERAIPLIRQFLRDFKGKTIAIGTHGNIMTIIMNYFDSSYGHEFWSSTSKPDIYKLVFEEAQLILVERVWNPELE